MSFSFKRSIQLCDLESSHKAVHFGLKGLGRTGRALQSRGSLVFKTGLVGKVFHLVGIVGIGLFLKRSRRHRTNIINCEDAFNLSGCRYRLSGTGVNISSAGLLVNDFSCQRINDTAALTLRYLNILLSTG